MTSRHTNPVADAAKALTDAILTLRAPRIPPQAYAEDADALATWREEIGRAVAAFDEEVAAIAADRGIKLSEEHLVSSADEPALVTDLRDAACEMAAEEPPPRPKRLTPAQAGVGGIKI